MSPRTLAGAALAGLAAAAVAVPAAHAVPDRAATPKITAEGVGKVKLGKRHSVLRAQGLVGPIGPGCELGLNTRSAKLKPPLKGSVNYTQSSPRKVTDITITGGAKARGVGIGATIPQIKAKFPHAKVRHGLESIANVTVVKIPQVDGGVFRFLVDVDTKETVSVGVPFVALCE
jgi:hypothetical protein